MVEFITLLGADDVRAAASSIRVAAGVMQSTAASMEDSLQRHRIFLDDWLYRLEEVIRKGGRE